MRRSKSNPAKYTKNYRSISQRRMTTTTTACNVDDDDDEEQEMQRLSAMLRESSSKAHAAAAADDDDDDTDVISPRKRRRPTEKEEQPNYTDILSAELLEEMGDDNAVVLLPSQKKKKAKTKQKSLLPQLSLQEIRQAKLLQKKTARKLQQLQQRAAQKQKRASLYNKLQETAISDKKRLLLTSSSTLGQKRSKRQELQRLLQKERAGIALNEQEKDLLYRDNRTTTTTMISSTLEETDIIPTAKTVDYSKEHKAAPSVVASKVEATNSQILEKVPESPADIQGDRTSSSVKSETNHKSAGVDNPSSSDDEKVVAQNKRPDAASVKDDDDDDDDDDMPQTKDDKPSSFAAQMMASLSKLKTESAIQAEKVAQEEELRAREQRELEMKQQKKPKKRYIPAEPVILKTAASVGISCNNNTEQQQAQRHRAKIREIERPPDIQATRYDLPVSEMEFEVMDAIRNHDVTIICGETGSGKSTQIPQFLYEAGLTSSSPNNDCSSKEQHFCIGVTQPRRVAAVSTAKRVCYEMGQGNGKSIIANNKSNKKGGGNLVAYQTRYETAGLGRDTHVKFMTDGILLQEIQSDLLLRKYSVIVLDEAHERNLNTDVLIGLLSAAIPLRKQAAVNEPDSNLVPLKLVIMSATLRVEDFTTTADDKKKKLFASSTTLSVVKIPGRTYPVTVHHSKVTELDDYEEVAFKKICKIHRKLPQGGILVFLTGKQEIVRMVNRLRRALNPTDKKKYHDNIFSKDVTLLHSDAVAESGNQGVIPREMDDEEFDGDLFRPDGMDDDFDITEQGDDDIGQDAVDISSNAEDGIPKKAHVFPLYSLLSADEQARVFEPVPDGHRLIVVATNIAETSITIPGISYVVDTGRQKCRNYHTGTGIASYDIMWISKASADQRAGRAGRTGPGHCYRLYSSSMYSRHMDAFALPEVLTRPLEDVVLAMKAMNISNVSNFPFPTPPEPTQLKAALDILANIGCVDVSNVEKRGGDGEVTRLGAAVAKLPLGVRYGKMLLCAAQAGVLDYAIVMVAVLSESSPFLNTGEQDIEGEGVSDDSDADEGTDTPAQKGVASSHRWKHKGGDVTAATLAVGAYTYAGRGAGGEAEKLACKKFCKENALNPTIMDRIQKMRMHLARLANARLRSAEGIAAKTGGMLSSMPPPNKVQEQLLRQSIASGLLDNVAMLAPFGSIPGEHPFSLRSAYLSCSSRVKEPLFMDRNSVVYSRDSRVPPKWICFDSLVRKTLKDGNAVAVMKNITPIDACWLGSLATGSRLLSLGEPQALPIPVYDRERDAIMCSVTTKFGCHGWEIPPLRTEMFDALHAPDAKQNINFSPDDSFRWFARFLLEGKILPELQELEDMLNDSPSIITRRTPVKKVALLVSALSRAGIDSASALRKHWSEVDDKFLFKNLRHWIKSNRVSDAKKIWIDTVRRNSKQAQSA